MSVTLNGVLQTIDAMQRYFRGGFGWGKMLLHNPLNGRKCLVGAVQSVRASDGHSSWVPSEEIEAAKHYIGRAVHEHGGSGGGGDWAIMNYNDAQRSYHEIAAVMTRAKELAMMEYARQQPAPAPVVEILPPTPAPAFLRPPPNFAELFGGATPPVAQAPAARPALIYQPQEQVEIITLADMERVAVKRG